jgi:penicillin amidase
MNLPRLVMRLLLGPRLPITSGTRGVAGIEHEIVIRRDRWGVPHITAQSESDAWYALGFCHGQDRAFQLETLLRVARGTLSELLGPDGLAIDRLSRRIGFIRTAEQQMQVVSPQVRAALEAYARGVNAGATEGTRRLAHEFVLLRSRPTPWRAVDALGYGKVLSFLLATNWDVELARLKILTEDGAEALQALDPAYPEWQPVISPPGAPAGPALDRLIEDAVTFIGVVGGGGGSNNWSLAATRTGTGRPILANDPHLAPSLPPHWYLVHITTPEWSLAGASFLGLPIVGAGHNEFAAWGVTVGMTDNTDLFLEEVGPDGHTLRQGEDFVPCEVRVERIAVKGRADVTEEVLVTPRGPVISPALDGEAGAISMRAVWLDPLPIDGLFSVHRARSFEEFRAAFADWPALPLNMAYADETGTIGWQLIGAAPKRRKGHGAVPLPGRDPEAGWEDGLVPHQEMPYLVNPDTGWIVTANNKVIRDGDGPFLTVDWLDGYRAARILEVLQGREDWDPASMTAVQLDQESLPWWEMRQAVLAASSGNPNTAQALELLRRWDGQLTADSPAAAVFELFVAEMSKRVARARVPRGYAWALGLGYPPLVTQTAVSARRVGHLVGLLRAQPPDWFPRSWDDEIGEALSDAVHLLQSKHGSNVSAWAWGKIRPLTLTHPFGQRKPFDRIFNLGPIPWGGDCNTPSQAAVLPLDPTANPAFIASLRMVVDVGEWENSRFVLPGGQSGNPFSPHYADQFPLWQRGESIPIPWSPAAVEQATRDTLRLFPA